MENCIYIVVSQTGTILSKTIRLVTGAKYTHASISLNASLNTMYSFGRIRQRNPFVGGFVLESPETGPFRRVFDIPIVVIAIPITTDTYNALRKYLENMYQMRYFYRYNYRGLILAAVHRGCHSPYRFYCSEFVQDVLFRFQLLSADQLRDAIHPIHFLNISGGHVIYEGTMRHYIENIAC